MGNNNSKHIHFHDYAKMGKVEEVMKCLEEEPSLVDGLDNVSQ
jgi:hypothetical protein